ncbi:MAG: DUF192 domain-containing protein [Thermodesulfobacteriota bacterium]
MKYGILHARNEDGEQILLEPVRQTTSAMERMRGLLGHPPPHPGEGLLLQPCTSVHTLFMRYPVDVVYLDQNYQVLKVVPALNPYRASFAFRAVAVLEMGAHQAASCGIHPGICFKWEER